mgnify:CR=1 FL=1
MFIWEMKRKRTINCESVYECKMCLNLTDPLQADNSNTMLYWYIHIYNWLVASHLHGKLNFLLKIYATKNNSVYMYTCTINDSVWVLTNEILGHNVSVCVNIWAVAIT